MLPPVFDELNRAQTILLAGAGGGFDVFTGLPLYFWLKKTGKTVHLANLSFTDLAHCDGVRPVPSLMRVTAETEGPVHYFPEGYLARWLAGRSDAAPVYAIERAGVRPVAAAYAHLVETLKPDTLLLVDGGMDSLMRGDEFGLGTPEEDMASMVAAADVPGVARKLLVSIGFGIDTYHGVCHAHFLQNVATLIGKDAFLGSWSLDRNSEEFRLYEQAYEYTAAYMQHRPSIVNASLISAVNGWFGDRHAVKRTHGSKLFINPLMGICWAFHLEQVVKQNLYVNHIRQTDTYAQLSLAIETFRATCPATRQWEDIPS